MDNLWLEGKKLSANISKFIRNNSIRKADKHDALDTKGTFFKPRSAAYETGCNLGKKDETVFLKGGAKLSYADLLKKGTKHFSKYESSVKEEPNHTIFFTSSAEDRVRFNKAKVGIMRILGKAYGVNKSLVEEGIFTITATPLVPNLCLLEETVEGDLETLLQDAGEWKEAWFKEVLPWKFSDVECARATCLSIFGIPCYVRNSRFLESLLADIGYLANPKSVDDKAEIMDVIRIMIFTNQIGPISRKINACVDGEIFTLMLIEDDSVSIDKGGLSSASSSSSELMEDEDGSFLSDSETEEGRVGRADDGGERISSGTGDDADTSYTAVRKNCEN